MIPAKPYFYNVIDEISDEELKIASDIANKKINDFYEIISDYESWKKLTKDYNKLIRDKNRKLETSRYEWHQQYEVFIKRKKDFENASNSDIISAAYNDAFYHNEKLYYPVNYPQIFRVALALNSVNQIISSEDEAIKYLENLPETCILGATDEDHIEYKEVIENIASFFDKYNKGLLFISNGVGNY